MVKLNIPQTPEKRRTLSEDMCSHHVPWVIDCPECEQVWRVECLRRLRNEAEKFGFKLTPL